MDSRRSARRGRPSGVEVSQLRDYQQRGIESLRSCVREGKRRPLLVAPTGSGKTILISEIARSHLAKTNAARVLVVVHRAELVTQTIAKLTAAGVDRVGVIAAGRDFDHDAPVLVASVQTLLARDTLPDDVTLLILDEAHHYCADEWRRVADHYCAALTIGFTATPMRGDGTALGDIFDSIVVVAQIPELIAAGHLCPIDVVTAARATSGLCEDPLEAWERHAGPRPGVAFCASVQDSRSLADRMNEGGRRAAAIWGDMANDAREDALARFAAGDLDVLTNCFVLTEGWDAPRAEVCMIARGVDHVGTFLQMVGRVLRPAPGKTGALLIDLRGVVHVHGAPDELRTFSLDGRAISGPAPTKDCPACGSEIPLSARECPDCGNAFEPHARGFDLAPLERLTKDGRERAFFEHHLRIARSRGWSDGVAVAKFKAKFGRAPWALWRAFGCKSRKSEAA